MNTSFWKDKQVLVTGAGGFIGSHLTETLLDAGARVRALVRYNSRSSWGHLEDLAPERRERCEIVLGDVTDPYAPRGWVDGCHSVFHLAALIGIPYSYQAPASYIDVNVRGTVNLLEASRAAGVARFVHTSTSETYGTALRVPIDESHPLQGQSPYSASKIAADKMAESYHRSFGLPVVVVRPFNTYGPRQSSRAVIPTIVTQALTRDFISLGSLDPIRDLTFVKDTALGFLACAEAEEAVGEVLNLGTGSGVSIGELAQKILRLMGVEKPIRTQPQRVRPEQSEVMRLICDPSLVEKTTGSPKRSTGFEPASTNTRWIRMSSEPTRAIVLAGGQGTRLRPYTIVIPKPLVPVGDMPILEIVIRQLAASGLRDITIAVGHLSELVQSFFGDGSKWGVRLTYSIEDKPLNTIGPLKLIPDLKGDFLVLNGDLLTDIDFGKLLDRHKESGAALTVASYKRTVKVDFGVLRTDDGSRIVGFEEKPKIGYDVSMGVYVLHERVLPHIPQGRPFGFDQLVLALLAAGEHVASYPHDGYWLDIGRPDDYERAIADFESLRHRLLPNDEARQ